MKDELFQELLESVKQGAAIMKGESQPSCIFEILRLLACGEKEIEAGVGFYLESVMVEADGRSANQP